MNSRLILNAMDRVQLQHIYREGNVVVDDVAAIGFGLKEITYWRGIENLTIKIKALICRERMAMKDTV